MQEFRSKEKSYKSCQAGGFFIKLLYVNKQRAKSLLDNADTNLSSANKLADALQKGDKGWMNVYTMHYEALRICIEALMIFDKVVSKNHECLFACLCVRRPELELDWNFLNSARRKRNGANYYGERISYEDWKSVEVQVKLYISTLKKEIEKLL